MDATYKTCKLSLPLFFLIVRTNVGYSVIAEFIVQHEDSQCIAEALGLLHAQWDVNEITVVNFMIDCQQSEENAIRGIFPESVIFLCSFHRLQAWLRWLVNGKNGVSQYKDQCMSILHSLGESKTEDEYTKNLLRLQKSHVWSRFLNLRNYYTQQWAPKKKVNISENKWKNNSSYLLLFVYIIPVYSFQMWVQAYRIGKQLYDNTNNGIEAQNKAFKYSFLNCCRNLSMSHLIYLLVDIFVPAQTSK